MNTFKVDFYFCAFFLVVCLNIVTIWPRIFTSNDNCCREYMASELTCINTPNSEPVTAMEVRTSKDGKNWKMSYFIPGTETPIPFPVGAAAEYPNACHAVAEALQCMYDGAGATLFIFDTHKARPVLWQDGNQVETPDWSLLAWP